MQNRLTVWGLVLGTVALAGGSAPALAQVLERALAVETAPATSTAPALETSYTYENLFSIAFPAGWQVREQAAAPQVVASGGASATLPAMRTEIQWHEAPPREVVGAALQDIQTSGYTVTNYDAATIDGVAAIRLWLSEIPADLPNAFVTYVGYPEATAVITSYYGDTTAPVDPLLKAIHQSFQRSPQPGS